MAACASTSDMVQEIVISLWIFDRYLISYCVLIKLIARFMDDETRVTITTRTFTAFVDKTQQ